MSKSTPGGRYTPPAKDLPSFNCPCCGALTQQDWHALGYEIDHEGVEYWRSMEAVQVAPLPKDDPWANQGAQWTNTWNGAQCFSCGEWSVWRDDCMVYPPARVGTVASADMPDEVRTLHTEAAQVAAVSPRAGVALARAAVERLLKILDPDAPSKAKLVDFVDRVRPRVSAPLGQLLDVVRVTGNQALHVDEQPPELILLVLDSTVGPGVLETLLETANDLVDELITRPQRARELWEKLPDGVKAQVPAAKVAVPPPGTNGG